MVQPVSIFTPVETENKLSMLPALYLSPLFCYKEVAVFKPNETDVNQICDRKNYSTTFTATVLKIATYILSVGILPLLAIVLNLVIRANTDYKYAVHESLPSSPPVATSPSETYEDIATRILEGDEQPSAASTNDREIAIMQFMGLGRANLLAILDTEEGNENRGIIQEAINRVEEDDSFFEEDPVPPAPGVPVDTGDVPVDADLMQLAGDNGYYDLSVSELREEHAREVVKYDQALGANQVGISTQHATNMQAIEMRIRDMGEPFHPEAPASQPPPPTAPTNEETPVQTAPLPAVELSSINEEEAKRQAAITARLAKFGGNTKLTNVEVPAALQPTPLPVTPPVVRLPALKPEAEPKQKKLAEKVIAVAISTTSDQLPSPLNDASPHPSSPTHNNGLSEEAPIAPPPKSEESKAVSGESIEETKTKETQEFLRQMREVVRSKNTPPSSPPKSASASTVLEG